MKKLICLSIALCMLLLLCSCSSGKKPGGSPEPASAETQAVKVREGSGYPALLRYERTRGETLEKAKTDDTYTMDDVLEAIDGLRITQAVTPDAGAGTDAIIFVDKDGGEERVEFCGGALLKNGTYYRAEGFEALQRALDKMMENFGGLEHPYSLTAQPFQDDRDGLYWIFFEAGHGARFTGFDGDWFVGEQLFTWGVDEGILCIFPAGGEEEQYPLTFSDSIDDKTVSLGELTLKEVYPKELEALYNQWVPIGRQIKAKLEAGS